MSIYGELYSIQEHKRKFAFESKRKHKAEVNIPNFSYPVQHIDTEIPHGSSGHFIVPDTAKVTFNLGIESKYKTRSIVNNVGTALVQKIC